MTPLAQHRDGSRADDPPKTAEREPAEAMSFDRLYEDHVDFVWRAACRLGIDGVDADDVAQEVFFIAHRRLREFAGRSSAKTWLLWPVREAAFLYSSKYAAGTGSPRKLIY